MFKDNQDKLYWRYKEEWRMILKINNVVITAYPKEFQVTPLDIDDGESSARAADGNLTRDRVAVKRQIDMTFGILTWPEMSGILQSMSATFFDFSYPDPMDGIYATRTFYVGNRPAGVAVDDASGLKWSGLKITLTQK